MTKTSKRVRAKIVVPSCQLSVLEGPDAGKSQEWHQRLIRVGRDDTNDCILTDPAISGCHFTLQHDTEKGGYQLVDQDSTNGVWCDQLQLIQAYLNTRLLLNIGDTVLEFSPKDRWIEKTVGIPEDNPSSEEISYQAPAVQDLFARISCLADVDIPIIFLGETGTGKTTLARQLHQMSPRREHPFVSVNCASIPHHLFESEFFGYKRGAFTGATKDHDGFFVHARHGILFLDEIADLSLENQAKLLTVIEQQSFYPLGSKQIETTNVRILTATHQDLPEAVRQGRFREDLYYRIAVMEFRVPSLRERPADIPVLAQHFLENFGSKHPNKPTLSFSPEVFDLFLRYPWPGNIRALHNAILSSATYASTRPGSHVEILLQDLPSQIQQFSTLSAPSSLPSSTSPTSSISCHATSSTLAPSCFVSAYQPPFPVYEQEKQRILGDFQRAYLQSLLTHTGGNVSKASEISGIARPHFHTLMEKLGLSKK